MTELLVLFAASAHGQITGASKLLLNSDNSNQAWTGIGRFNASLTCTAFLIDPGGPATAPAYALSNGHCISTSSGNEVILDRAGGNLRVIFNYFQDTVDRQVSVPVKRIVYSTMKGLDLSVLELNSAIGDLRNAGITPLLLSQPAPEEGEPVFSVGAPNSGIPSDETFLRRADCTLGAAADLIEFIWHFHSGFANTCSDIRGGSSGSPVISQRSGTVVAIMNTTTAGAVHETGDFLCFSGQPCEITPGGTFTYRSNANYALPLTNVQHCFDQAGVFSPAADGCPLDPGRQFTVTLRQRAVRPPGSWQATLSGSAWTHYRYKTIAEGQDDCRNPQDYGEAIAFSERNRIDDALPETEGRYHLCVIGGDGAGADANWQDVRFATQVHLRVDTTPATIPIEYLFRYGREDYTVQPIFVVPELSGYRYRVDNSGSPPCEQDTGYSIYLRIPFRVPRSAARLCLRGEDDANNETLLAIPLLGLNVFPDGLRNGASLRATTAIAPGQLIKLLGVNLEGASVSLRGQQLQLLSNSEEQIDVVVPAEAAPGPDELIVSGPAGVTKVPVVVEESAPGLFRENGSPVASVFRNGEEIFTCPSAKGCFAPIDVAQGELHFVLRATGVTASDLWLDLGGEMLSASLGGEITPGMRSVEVRVPSTFPLRGYVPLRLINGARSSQTLFLRFR